MNRVSRDANTAQIVFIILKATHLITWSWWAVWSPTLVAAAVSILGLAATRILSMIKKGN
jgi:hypothetical protein